VFLLEGRGPWVSSPASNPGLCSGGNHLARSDSLEQTSTHVVLMVGGEDQKLSYLMLERGNES